MWRRFPATRQHDNSDCAGACLHSVARLYGSRVPVARIRQLAGTDTGGTTVLGLIEAATQLGFTAKGVRTTLETLPKLPHPSIAHLVLESGLHHFVVVCRLSRRGVVVMDPAEGRCVTMPVASFRERWSGVLVLLAPAPRFQAAHEGAPTLVRFWRLVRPHRTVLGQALLGAVAYTILGLATAIYVQKIVDFVLIDANTNLLNLLSLLMLGVVLFQTYIGAMKGIFTLRTGQRIDAALIMGYYRHLMTLPQSFFDTMRVGELVSRVNDAVRIRTFINDAALELIVDLLVVGFSFLLMFTYSWKLALTVLCALPIYALVYQVSNRVNRTALRRTMESGAELESHLVESLGVISTIKRFGLEPAATLRTETRFVRLLKPVYASGLTNIFAASGSDLVSRIAVVATMWMGSVLVIGGDLSAGELMSFYALVGYLIGPASRLVAANRTIQDALIAGDRLFEIMDLKRESDDDPRGSLPLRLSPSIRFEGVGFRYRHRTPVFDGLDLEIPAGKITAIVGESGSGKSTLLALVHDLYPLTKGKVSIGGFDIRNIRRESLLERIATVPQVVHLFAGTVIENIAPGDPEPDMLRLVTICDRLGMTEFVDALPRGFHTCLGENGSSLSGGQRQRLAIARALYRDPDILMLDEATSSLDSESEVCVRRVLGELKRKGKTVVVIAHRLGSVRQADGIVVLHRGKVVERGTHEELLRSGRHYATLWRHQIPGDLLAPAVPSLHR